MITCLNCGKKAKAIVQCVDCSKDYCSHCSKDADTMVCPHCGSETPPKVRVD